MIKKTCSGLLTGIVSGSKHTKLVSLSNKKCMTQPTLINLHPTEYSQEFHYYQFGGKLYKCVGSFNTPNDLSYEVCVPNKTEELNLKAFNEITRINESKSLTKHMSFECKCKFEGRKSNSHHWWNNDKC